MNAPRKRKQSNSNNNMRPVQRPNRGPVNLEPQFDAAAEDTSNDEAIAFALQAAGSVDDDEAIATALQHEDSPEGGDPTDDTICAICRDGLRSGGQNKALECGHCFHKQCIDRWLPMKATCPTCSTSVTTE